MWTEIAQTALLIFPVLALLAFMTWRQRAPAVTAVSAEDPAYSRWRSGHRRDALVLGVTTAVIAIVLAQVDGRTERSVLPMLGKELISERTTETRLIDTTPHQTPIPRTSLASVDEMIDRLERRLDKFPNDVNGWRMLGWSYLHTDRPKEAIHSYRKAITLQPDDAGLRSSIAEALIADANGTVAEEARVEIDHALARDPKDNLGRYLHGIQLQQAGDRSEAIRSWRELVAELPADDLIAKLSQDKLSTLSIIANQPLAAPDAAKP